MKKNNEGSAFPHLSSPLKIAGLTLKNRMFSAPMSVPEFDAAFQFKDTFIDYFKLRAMGGAALVTIGEGMVDLNRGRSHDQQIGLNDPSCIASLCKIVEAIHSGGAAASIEIDHGGNLCVPEFIHGQNPIGPSGYVTEWGVTVEEMSEDMIYEVADMYASAAANAKALGFDMVMVHAGHGWLIHQFLSPLTNFRRDKWGGPIENRVRFMQLVVDKVRAAVGKAFPIEVRISGSERTEEEVIEMNLAGATRTGGGYGLDTGIEIAKALDGRADLIHVSAGTQYYDYSAQLMHPGAYQKDAENAFLAKEISKHVTTPLSVVGAFNLPEDMEGFIADGYAAAVNLGRALIADPFLPRKVILGRAGEITPCMRCMDCYDGLIAHHIVRCAVNPVIGREKDVLRPFDAQVKKKILIAGAGPAGMEAAIRAHEKGHEVVLCEAGPKIGALPFCDNDVDFKIPMRRYRDSQVRKVMALPIDIRLNTKVTPEIVEAVHPDAIIAAVGSVPVRLPVPGADGPNVVFVTDVTDDMPVGNRVAVIGGGLAGCEEAITMARRGHKVTIIEMLPELAADCLKMNKLNLMHHLAKAGDVTAVTGVRCTRIDVEGVYAEDADGTEQFFPADTVISAVGMRSRYDEVEALRSLSKEFYVIGDAARAGKIIAGTYGAYDAVAALGMM
jgi:2,4-dienoyl-CoA reductase-like NADH-dependent reductase (Old Yellow Enzyme family)/thioredoxin reductase